MCSRYADGRSASSVLPTAALEGYFKREHGCGAPLGGARLATGTAALRRISDESHRADALADLVSPSIGGGKSQLECGVVCYGGCQRA